MKTLKINERCEIKASKKNNQQCIYCGESVSEQLAISLNNSTDKLVLKKILWLHIRCVDKFFKQIKKTIKDNKKEILARLLE